MFIRRHTCHVSTFLLISSQLRKQFRFLSLSFRLNFSHLPQQLVTLRTIRYFTHFLHSSFLRVIAFHRIVRETVFRDSAFLHLCECQRDQKETDQRETTKMNRLILQSEVHKRYLSLLKCSLRRFYSGNREAVKYDKSAISIRKLKKFYCNYILAAFRYASTGSLQFTFVYRNAAIIIIYLYWL